MLTSSSRHHRASLPIPATPENPDADLIALCVEVVRLDRQIAIFRDLHAEDVVADLRHHQQAHMALINIIMALTAKGQAFKAEALEHIVL